MKAYATRQLGGLAIAGLLAASLSIIAPRIDARPSRHAFAPDAGRATAPHTISGTARVVDGDTLSVAGTRVRLEGIDAPEAGQSCKRRNGASWACGAAATSALQRLINGRTVVCTQSGLDRYGRVLGTCHAGNVDVSAELVRRGLAWAFVKYSYTYAEIEHQARAKRIGVWEARNQPPWDYRVQHWDVAEGKAPTGCAIKGNVTSKGKIYHMPWSPWYGRIRMDMDRGKRWFCSEQEAISAGWRPVGGT